MNIQNQLTQNVVSYLSKHPKPCLKNMLFYLPRLICMTVENKNVTRMKLKELRTISKIQIYPKMTVKKGIEKMLVISQGQLRSEKLKNNDGI